MRHMMLVFAFMTTAFAAAHAEETVCTVKGMHCQGCKEMVEGKVCDKSKYATCNVEIVDAKKNLGQVTLVTKDAAAKVDQKAVGALIKDAGYTLDKCADKAKAKTKG